MGSKRLVLSLVTAFALAIASASCERQALSEGAVPGLPLPGQAAGCNLLLITLDTTRADRLGCYGWEDAHTPHLDALAESGTRFEQAYSHVPITLPSHASLLTGTRPPENGVRDNARYRLGGELPTLAGSFRQRGYRTGAFVSAAVLDSRYGLDRDFETYDDELGKGPAGQSRSQSPAGATCDRALAWLGRVEREPFMCWVHFFEPHVPYEAPRDYVNKTSNPYDAEVAYMDANVGRLVGWLRSNSLLSTTLIVVVSDHGESLGEHGYLWHSVLLYEAEMRVALIVSLPGRLPTGRVSSPLASVSDVMPTVLGLMGWPTPREVTGVSLVPALEGRVEGVRKMIYAETDYPYNSYGWSKLRCLMDEEWKYIRAPRVELYDRPNDRGDSNDLSNTYPEVAERFEQQLAALEAGMTRYGSESLGLDGAALEVLRSLGYVGATAPSTPASAELKNPVDMLDVVHNFRKAETLLEAEQLLEAIALLEPAVERSPESVAVVMLLGKAYGMAGYLEASQRQLARAVDLYPEASSAHYLLARVLGMRERFGPCAESCRKVLDINPDHEAARKTLALAEGLVRRRHEEIEQCRAALRAAPRSVELRLRLNHLLDTVGKAKGCYAVLREGLAHNPNDASLADAMARLLATTWEARLRKGGEAVRLARLACGASNGQNRDHLATLAAAYAEAGRFEEALHTARRARDLYAQAGDLRSVGSVGLQIELFEAGRPYRALP